MSVDTIFEYLFKSLLFLYQKQTDQTPSPASTVSKAEALEIAASSTYRTRRTTAALAAAATQESQEKGLPQKSCLKTRLNEILNLIFQNRIKTRERAIRFNLLVNLLKRKRKWDFVWFILDRWQSFWIYNLFIMFKIIIDLYVFFLLFL